MPRESLQKLYLEQLQDLYSAEEQILEALPKMAKKTEHAELKKAFQQHEVVTREQVTRLEKIFADLGEKPGGHTCKGMKGLVAEGEEVMKEFEDSDVRDAAMIAAAQRVEHYEIAGYGCARTYANMLGLDEHAQLLQKTLDEEGRTDHLLTNLAESAVNVDAMKV
jgi:ferritin-like metal-binding protein YciE